MESAVTIIEGFEAEYAKRSGLSIEQLHQLGLRAQECTCGQPDCPGLAMVTVAAQHSCPASDVLPTAELLKLRTVQANRAIAQRQVLEARAQVAEYELALKELCDDLCRRYGSFDMATGRLVALEKTP